jgi:hypothetical protein
MARLAVLLKDWLDVLVVGDGGPLCHQEGWNADERSAETEFDSSSYHGTS